MAGPVDAIIAVKSKKIRTKYTMNAASCDFEQKEIAAFMTYAKMLKKLLTFFSLRSIL